MKRTIMGLLLMATILLVIAGCSSTYTISGQVTDESESFAGVLITVEGFGAAITGSDGKWAMQGVEGEVTVTPSADGYTFTPQSRTATKNNATDIDFVGSLKTYELVTSTSGNGAIERNPQQEVYDHGSAVQLTAVSDQGWEFSHWQGSASGTETTVTVTMDESKEVTAVFVAREYTLSVRAENGSVKVSPAKDVYHYGDQVTLTANPDKGWAFSHWDIWMMQPATSNPITITMSWHMEMYAIFTVLQHELTVDVVGDGTVMKEVVTDDMGATGYDHGTQIRLTASPASGWTFSHWEGDLTGSENPVVITLDDAKAVTAIFTQDEYTLSISSTGDGSVSKSPEQDVYHYGEEVTLTASADPGWTFSHWEGDLAGSESPAVITLDAAKSVTAIFTQNEYTLSVASTGNGSVAKSPDQAVYHYGDEVTLTASADPGWTFSHWEGNLTGSTNPATVTIDDLKSITAIFTQYAITVPHQYGSIQEAIDASQDGDIVIVFPGRYVENIRFNGKSITLRSTKPNDPDIVAATIIDGDNKDAVVRIEDGETNAVLTGFTITNGIGILWEDGSRMGGGVWVTSPSTTIQHNVVTGNSATGGGGVYYWGTDTLTFQDNMVIGNTASVFGGGLFLDGGSHTIQRNVVGDNSARRGGGGGLFYMGNGTLTIQDNMVIGNTSSQQGGGFFLGGGGGSHTIQGNVIADNSSANGGGLSAQAHDGTVVLTSNEFTRNTAQGEGGAAWVGASTTLLDDLGNQLPRPDTLNTYLGNSPDNLYYD